MLPNVFEPVIVKSPAPPWLSVQLNAEPPPTNVLAVAAVMEIVPVPVPAVVVKPVGELLLIAVAAAVGQSNVPALKVKFFVPAAVVNAVPTVNVCPNKSSVPLVRVAVLVEAIVNAS